MLRRVLFGSAAGLVAVSAAQAADLPVRKAAPVEFVRVCSTYGAGFFYIPGTDTCLRISGRARAQYQFVSTRSYANAQATGDIAGYSGQAWLNLDARTATDIGTVRTFIRYIMSGNTGASLNSNSNNRYGVAYSATGIDTFGRAQQSSFVDKAFIQFAGITAGRAASFFDFYSHDLEYHPTTSGSDVSSTNLLAYTATLGQGFTATISAEDPTYRRQPVYTYNGANLVSGTGPGTTTVNTNFFTAVPFAFDTNGLPIAVGNLDTIQRVRTPDVIGNLRLDQAWGSAQISAAMHEISIGKYGVGAGPNAFGVFAVSTQQASGVVTGPGTPVPFSAASAGTTTPTAGVTGVNIVKEPDAAYGFAVQGGLKVNLPQIAAGDLLYLQGAYGQGAIQFTGNAWAPARENPTFSVSGRFVTSTNDATVDRFGRLRLTESFSGTAAFLHYWVPQFRQAVFGSYSEVHFDADLRTGNGPANLIFGNGGTAGLTAAQGAALNAARTNFLYNPTLMDWSLITVGTNLIYSPIKDLDIGIEGVYQRAEVASRVNDANKNPQNVNVAGVPVATAKSDDVFLVRARVQRDF